MIMRKKITFLMGFLLIAFFSFGQEWQTVEKAEKKKEAKSKKEERGINPYRNDVDGVIVNRQAPQGKGTYQYNPSNSPADDAYDSNTYDENGWTDIAVSETENVAEVQIDYTWSTDFFASEGSFHLESPSGTSVVIASGQESGTYSVTLTDFEGEAMDGNWKLWIEDSYGDGGHQATDITVTFITPVANDAGISEIVSLNEDEIPYNGEKDMIVRLKNYGVDPLTIDSIGWGYIVDGDTTYNEPIEWTGNLANGETEDVNLGTINLEAGKTYQIGAWTYLPNGVEDENHMNDTMGVEIAVYQKGQLVESFEGTTFPPNDWKVINNDGGAEQWEQNNSYSYNGMNSASVRWESSDLTNDDWLITPKLLVEEGDELSFWARSTSSYFEDDFRVYVSKTGNNIQDFTTTLEEVMNAPYDWTQFNYVLTDHADISAGDEIYVAIQYFSLDQLRLAVDMFTGPLLTNVKDNDVAVTEVMGAIAQPGETVDLKALIENQGLNDQTDVEVTFSVGGESAGTATIGSLTYQQQDTAMVSWTAPTEIGLYTLEVSVPDDENNNNNTLTQKIWVLNEQPSFVMNYEDDELLNLTLPDAQNTELVSSTSTTIYAGTWAMGKWYAVSDANELLTVDTATGSMTSIGTLDLNSVTGIAYDWTTTTMYAMDYDGDNAVSKLYTVDLQTAEVSQVGLGSTEGININLACDLEGNLYSMNITDDVLMSISKTAGAGSVIGDLGIDASYAQDMEFDHNNGDILYATGYTDKGGLYVIDTETGMAHSLGQFEDGDELGGFAIPYTSPVPYPIEMHPMNNSEDNAVDTDIHVVFDQNVDSVDFSGITITGENSGAVSNVTAELQDSMLTISHDPLANNDNFTVTIPAGTVTAEEPNEEISWSFNTIMSAPEYTIFTPDTAAQGVALDAEVSVLFNQEISEVSLAGITMTGSQEGPVPAVTASIGSDNKSIVIDHADFAGFEDTITVSIPADAVENEDGIRNADTTWTFVTLKDGQPIADSIAPANNQSTVALDDEVLVRFNIDVNEVDLSGITIEGETEGAVNVTPTLTDSTITIAHDAFANNHERYTVTIPAGAVESVSTSEPNAEIKWSFTTIMAAPQMTTMVPEDGATAVPVDADLMFAFDQEIQTDYDLDTMITIVGENEDTVTNTSTTLNADGMGFTVTHDDMQYNTAQYTVTIPAGVVYNEDSVMNQNEATWTFTTIMAAPEAVETTPEDGATDVPLDAAISMSLNQNVTVNDLSVVTISSAAEGYVPNVNATLTDDSIINITHDDFYTVNDDIYTVRIPASAVMNSDGVYNQDITWTFQTVYTYDVTFVVQDGTEPVANATITVNGQEATTDAQGKGVINDLVKGSSYGYTIEKSGYETVTGNVAVQGEVVIPVQMTQVYSVTFNVTDGSDPVESASVNFNGMTQSTNASGEAVFEDVDTGTMPYEVSKDGYQTTTGTVTVNQQNVVENVVMDVAVGIEDLETAGIQIYPNPTTGTFYVTNDNKENMEILVKDLTGRTIINKTLSNDRNTINISDQSSGIYLIQLTRGNKTFNSKLILK